MHHQACQSSPTHLNITSSFLKLSSDMQTNSSRTRNTPRLPSSIVNTSKIMQIRFLKLLMVWDGINIRQDYITIVTNTIEMVSRTRSILELHTMLFPFVSKKYRIRKAILPQIKKVGCNEIKIWWTTIHKILLLLWAMLIFLIMKENMMKQ